jgi:hypothetical protein
MSFGVGLTLLLGTLGAIIGWRSQSKRMRWRSFLDKAPGGMTMEEYEQRRARMARVRRLIITALCAGAGVGISTIIVIYQR